MPHGELYGLKNDKSRFQPEFCMHLRPESGVPGLYLTGMLLLLLGWCLKLAIEKNNEFKLSPKINVKTIQSVPL